MKAMVVTDQAAGAAGMTLTERPDPVAASNDVVVEAADEGTDAVQTTASYTLSANIENMFLMGAGAIDGTGNDLDNYIAGNDSVNTIHGGGGGDTSVSGGGNDVLIGDGGDDKYVFDATSGSDVIDNTGGGFDGVGQIYRIVHAAHAAASAASDRLDEDREPHRVRSRDKLVHVVRRRGRR